MQSFQLRIVFSPIELIYDTPARVGERDSVEICSTEGADIYFTDQQTFSRKKKMVVFFEAIYLKGNCLGGLFVLFEFIVRRG